MKRKISRNCHQINYNTLAFMHYLIDYDVSRMCQCFSQKIPIYMVGPDFCF